MCTGRAPNVASKMRQNRILPIGEFSPYDRLKQTLLAMTRMVSTDYVHARSNFCDNTDVHELVIRFSYHISPSQYVRRRQMRMSWPNLVVVRFPLSCADVIQPVLIEYIFYIVMSSANGTRRLLLLFPSAWYSPLSIFSIFYSSPGTYNRVERLYWGELVIVATVRLLDKRCRCSGDRICRLPSRAS